MYEHEELNRPAYQEATRIYREELKRARERAEEEAELEEPLQAAMNKILQQALSALDTGADKRKPAKHEEDEEDEEDYEDEEEDEDEEDEDDEDEDEDDEDEDEEDEDDTAEIREQAYTNALLRLGREHGEQSEPYAAGLHYLASFLSSVDPDRAMPVWLRLLELERNLFGLMSEDVAGTLNNIGLHLLEDAAEHELGEAFLRMALAVSRQQSDAQPGLAEFQLAQSLSEADMPSRAIAWARRVVEVPGVDNELRGAALHILGMDLQRIGDVGAAETALQQALQALRSTKDVERLSSALRDYAQLLVTQERLGEARALLEEACELERTYSGDDEELWTVLESLLQVCGAQKDWAAIERYALEWLDSVIRSEEPENLEQALDDLGTILGKTGQPERRYGLLERAAKQHKDSVALARALAQCATDLGKLAEAEVAWKTAVRLADEQEDIEELDLRKQLALLYIDTGRTQEALAVARELEDDNLVVLAKTAQLAQTTVSTRTLWSLVRSVADRYSEED